MWLLHYQEYDCRPDVAHRDKLAHRQQRLNSVTLLGVNALVCLEKGEGPCDFIMFVSSESQSRQVDKVIILVFGHSSETITQCFWGWFTVRLVAPDRSHSGKKIAAGPVCLCEAVCVCVCLGFVCLPMENNTDEIISMDNCIHTEGDTCLNGKKG